MKTSGCAASARYSHDVPAFCTPSPRKSTHGATDRSGGRASCSADSAPALLMTDRPCLRLDSLDQIDDLAERQHADAVACGEPLEKLRERVEPPRTGLDPWMEADRDVRPAPLGRDHLPPPTLEHGRGREPFRLVAPIVVRDRKAPQRPCA